MALTDHAVVASLLPVVLLIAVGWGAGRLGWIREAAVKDLSNLVFLVLIPALLFRTMSGVRVETLDARPIGAYFTAALALLALLVPITLGAALLVLGPVYYLSLYLSFRDIFID